ncbi:hypothetical protein TREMEDRAFT_31374 [Tremella mesenterica DSM 1558]|uniref:uncharacterized protein n=1 Tax=Tremella mesenterica (strain ATCC 24925 / CBS 8224 / DSM 1558 / NBRC 9311 / NRRL Y-6157 / RJB 2259-6 / UBC 559-6) TaxID=578456 RepID=UPI0003F494C4|nr:uncharacterized protein TREMEDRAFT_31374 [Tremella mesenterica DSM 1558]EIW69193.1 hypothetical protein TREMEDRAFT_31374 [Tremella mesenterica DSM 1558]
MASAAYTDCILLFGDSLTQAWSPGSLAQRMAEHYLRRLDIVNRGYGGYNSDWASPVFEQIFTKASVREAGQSQAVRMITIWFGANDAVLPGQRQHVPLDRYKTNLSKLISLIRSPASEWYSPQTKIILINPPPIIETAWHLSSLQKWRDFGSKGDPPTPNRDRRVTKQYAEACVEVAKAEGVDVIDFWNTLVQRAGGEEPERLAPFFYDGLHLTAEGYKVLFEALKGLINSKYPELNPETMEMRMPHWADVGLDAPEKAFEGVQRRRLIGEL